MFAERADYFFARCITDLQSFETAKLTRPIVILMTNAYMQKLNDLQPRDFIDVQSFFWVTVAPKGKTRAASRAKR